MANRKYTIARPLQDVRLRSWGPGDVQKFKKVVESLETELNKTISSQIAQNATRVISKKVPVITTLAVRAGFKNFQLTWNAAKGLKDLLFYEVQKSVDSGYSDPTSYTIPETSIAIPARVAFQQVFFRVRAINSKFEAGPWSQSVATVARNFFTLNVKNTDNLFDGSQIPTNVTVTDIAPASFNTWVDVGGTNYSPSAASVAFIFHAGVQASCINHFTVGDGVAKTITNDASVALRVVIGGVTQPDQANCRAWGNQARTAGPGSTFSRYEHVVMSSLTTGFLSYTGSEAVTPYRIQAKVLSETCSTDKTSGVKSVRTYNDNVRIIVSATTILEVIQTT